MPRVLKKSQRFNFVYHKYKGICHLCDKPVPRDKADRDHIVPRAYFKHIGVNRPGWRINTALAHKYCNFARGIRSVNDYRISIGLEPKMLSEIELRFNFLGTDDNWKVKVYHHQLAIVDQLHEIENDNTS